MRDMLMLFAVLAGLLAGLVFAIAGLLSDRIHALLQRLQRPREPVLQPTETTQID